MGIWISVTNVYVSFSYRITSFQFLVLKEDITSDNIYTLPTETQKINLFIYFSYKEKSSKFKQIFI